MFCHHSTATMTGAFLCAAPRQAVLTGFPHLRCLFKGYTSARHCQSLHRGFTLQQARWHWWSGQQQGLSKTFGRHQIPIKIICGDKTQYSTRNIISEQTYSTNKEDGLAGTSDTAEKDEKDEVDLEALVELEVDLYRQEAVPMPSTFTPTQWQELLGTRSVSGRKKYLTFLFKNEMKRLNKVKVKEINRERREEEDRQRRENPPQAGEHIEYGLWKNSIFLKILETTINHFDHSRVVQAMLFGQPLVVDMDFEKHMTNKERQNCAYQIQMMISANRKHQDPYSLELHNAPPTLDTMTRLERYVPPLYDPEYPVPINPKSYLDKYPKEQLVYLTPHCQEELLVYDHNAVYIIGAIVDKSSGEPLSLAKAKREGIRMQKLPLDRYLAWGTGNKSLTFNQMISIMLDLKVTGDWSQALRHVPRRKLQPSTGVHRTKEEALLQRIERREKGYRNY